MPEILPQDNNKGTLQKPHLVALVICSGGMPPARSRPTTSKRVQGEPKKERVPYSVTVWVVITGA